MINDYATPPSDAELIQFATDEQFLLFCDEDEFLDIARAVLQRYSAAIEAHHKRRSEPDVLPGEAIFGFAAWLTSLKTPVTFSECHGAAIGADLAAAYNTSQGFDEVREDFHKRLKPCPAEPHTDAPKASA